MLHLFLCLFIFIIQSLVGTLFGILLLAMIYFTWGNYTYNKEVAERKEKYSNIGRGNNLSAVDNAEQSRLERQGLLSSAE